MSRAFGTITIVVALLAAAGRIFAVEATNVDTGLTLFDSAGFENDSIGTPPSASSAGNWVATSGLDTVTTGGSPGASEGFKYLSTTRGSSSGNPRAFFTAPQTTVGQQIHMEFMLYIPSGADIAIILETETAAFYRGLGRLQVGTFWYYNGSSYINTGLAYIENQWQKWEIDYVIGSTTWQASIDGSSTAALALDGLMQPGGGSLRGLSFGHNGNQTYYIDATDSTSAIPANDDCANARAISDGFLSDSTANASNDGSASCGNSTSSPDVWYLYNATCTGNLSVSSCGSDFDTVLSVHDGLSCPGAPGTEVAAGCKDDCGGAPCGGSASCVTVPVATGNPYLVRVSGANGAAGGFLMSVSCSPPPPNDHCTNALPITIGTTVTDSTIAATNDGSSGCDSLTGSPDVWYEYQSTFTGKLNVETCGSGFDTIVSVYDNSVCPGSSLSELGCNDDCADGSPCIGPRSCATVPVTQGETYRIRVAGADGEAGAFNLSLQEIKSFNVTYQVGPDLPQGFQDSDGGIIHNTLITVGGFCSGITADQAIKPGVYPRGFLKKAWGLDLAARQNGWFALPDFPGVARQGLSAAVVNEEIYIWGGFNYTDPYCYEDGWRLSKQGSTWVWSSLPSLPWKLTSTAMTVVGAKIYAFGGADYDRITFHTAADRTGTITNLGARLLVFDTQNQGAGWQELTQCPGTHRFVHAAAAVNGKVYVIGGAAGGGTFCTVADNWVYDPSTDQWSPIPDLPVASGNFPRGSDLVYQDRYIVLPGGYPYGCTIDNRVSISPYGSPSSHPNQPYLYGTFFNDFFVYDTADASFSSSDRLPYNNNLPMTVVHDDEIFLIGGETGGVIVEGTYYGHHPELCMIGQIESLIPGAVGPDFDEDGDVDQDDFGQFQSCLTDLPSVPLDPACQDADFDSDGHVDFEDVAIFLGCVSGPGVPANADCAN